MSEQELIELLADTVHASWARWMEYLFSQCIQVEGEGYVYTFIPTHLVVRWEKQIDTPYSDLTEQEKQSDRNEAAHILPIIKEYAASNLPLKDEWKETIAQFIQQKLGDENPT